MYLESGWWGLTRKWRQSRKDVVWDGHSDVCVLQHVEMPQSHGWEAAWH